MSNLFYVRIAQTGVLMRLVGPGTKSEVIDAAMMDVAEQLDRPNAARRNLTEQLQYPIKDGSTVVVATACSVDEFLEPFVKKMYHGDNGQHEFWENQGGTLMFFRNHQEQYWNVIRNGGWVKSIESPEEAAREFGVILDRSKTWKDGPKNAKKMSLV